MYLLYIGVKLKQMSGDQEKFYFGSNWSHRSHFLFDFSRGENNFNEFDSGGYIYNYFFSFEMGTVR